MNKNKRKIGIILMLGALTFKGLSEEANIIKILESKGKIDSKISVLENKLKENQGLSLESLTLDISGKIFKSLKGDVKDENIDQLPNELIEFNVSNLKSGYLVFPDKLYKYDLNSGWKKFPAAETVMDYSKLGFLHVSTDERINNKANKVWKNPENEKEIFVEVEEDGKTIQYIYITDEDGFIQSIVEKMGEKVVFRQKNQFLNSYNFLVDIDQESEKLSKTLQTEASVSFYATNVKTAGILVQEKNGQVVISQVALKAPAYQAGVRAGQILKKIDGSDVKPKDKKLLSLIGKSGETNKVNISITVEDEEQGLKDLNFGLVLTKNLIKNNGKMDVEILLPEN